MNRLNTLFENKKTGILSVYFTAGYPFTESTCQIIQALDKGGADIIEIGMPFSDPVADGPTIQESNKIALDNGMTIRLLFQQIKDIRQQSQKPLVLMGYLNPVMRFGIEAFCKTAAECGIDALILPDLPVKEYEKHYQSLFRKYGLSNIFFITPQTSEERIREMDRATDTFLYMVSSPGITGAKKGIENTQIAYFERIKAMNLVHPCLIGFGISNKETFQTACTYSAGAIIGSAFINALTENAEIGSSVPAFMDKILR